MARHDAVYHAAAVLTVAIWGTTFVSTKVLLQHGLPPAEIFLLRSVQAYLLILLFRHKHRRVAWRDELLMLLAGVTGGSFYFLAENTALSYTLAGNVSLVVSTAPLLTAVLAAFAPSAPRPSRRLWLGSGFALLGVAMVVMNGAASLEFHLTGDLLELSAAFSWAIYQLISKRLCDRYGATLPHSESLRLRHTHHSGLLPVPSAQYRSRSLSPASRVG